MASFALEVPNTDAFVEGSAGDVRQLLAAHVKNSQSVALR